MLVHLERDDLGGHGLKRDVSLRLSRVHSPVSYYCDLYVPRGGQIRMMKQLRQTDPQEHAVRRWSQAEHVSPFPLCY